MRLIVRLIGTWLLALALILVVIDGTRTLGANRLVITSLGEAWRWLHADSLKAVEDFVTTRFFGALLDGVVTALLTFPGWAVLAALGALLTWAGRTRRTRFFVRHDQI